MWGRKGDAALITPYGGTLINLLVQEEDRAACREKATFLPSIQISARSLCDLELLCCGAFSPVDRFMGEKDYTSVLKEMRLSEGTLFPVPLTLPVADRTGLEPGREIALRDPTNDMLAIMRIEELYAWDLEQEASAVLGTTDSRHPLVAEMHTWGKYYLSGPLTVFNLPRHHDFPDLRMTPAGVRTRLKEMGRENVIVYQPRDPMHRVHEALTKRAMNDIKGSLLIHPAVGTPKYGDQDHYTRVRCYQALVDHYYDPSNTVLGITPLVMRMAGPRSGLWHGIISRNYGANFFIAGTDLHCTKTDARGAWYDSSEVLQCYRDHEDELGIRLIPIKEMVYFPQDDTYEEAANVLPGNAVPCVKVSETRIVEDSLFNGQALPEWFTRPEVARILHEESPPKTRQGFCLWLTGLPSSGKSTIADVLVPLLMARGKRVTFLDGDIVRTHLTKGLGFGKEDRIANIIRVGFVAAEVVRHEGVAVCALISPYTAARDQVRSMIGEDRFIEIFVDTPVEVCEVRDVKGMYAKAKRGEIKGFTGVDDAYEPPRTPELRIDAANMTPEESAKMVLNVLTEKGFLAAREKADHLREGPLAASAAPKTVNACTRAERATPTLFQERRLFMKEQEQKHMHTSHNRPRPVLMIPLRRCGSHALRLRLNANPDFYAPYPLHIVDFMPGLEAYGDLRDDKSYFQLIIDVIGLQTASMVKWPEVVFDPVEIFESIRNEPRSIHRVVWELLFQAGAKRGARVVMDKSLDSVHYADELTALFDDMLFLNVVRDPRAQINSMNRAIIHDFDTLLNAGTWVRAYETGRNIATKYPDKALTIRYEDFISNQKAVLRRICAFFGIEFLPSMLDVSRSSEAQKISALSALWESNNKAPVPANVDKFKKTLTAEEIEIIETLAGGTMDYYGYERMTEGKAKITPRMIAAAKKRSEANREKAWADLEKNDSRDYQLRKFRGDFLQTVKNRLHKAGEMTGPRRDVLLENAVQPAGSTPQQKPAGPLSEVFPGRKKQAVADAADLTSGAGDPTQPDQ